MSAENAANQPASAPVRSAFRQPAFVITVVLLAVCAATLNTATAWMKVHFKKQAVPLRVASLKAGIPDKLGNWVQITPDTSIDSEIQQVLGTSEYVFRTYVDSRKVTMEDIDFLKDPNTPAAAREQKLVMLEAQQPASIIRAAVTYYTGLVDTVAHVPERCYVADGFEVAQAETNSATLGTHADGSPRVLDYCFLSFKDTTNGRNSVARVARNVGYVFHCDGDYVSSPTGVRLRLQNLFERYGYYAKVELMTTAPMPDSSAAEASQVNDRQASITAMEDFLSEALPKVEQCLPDWKALHPGQGSSKVGG